MNQIVAKENAPRFGALESVLIQGDLSKLNEAQRVTYYYRVCESLDLNPLTQPFEYIAFQGKLTLYAKRNCSDQLRQKHRISVRIVSRERIGDLLVVTAQASTPDGRVDESIGAISVGKLQGDALANAMMKAETKAKRRVTLSICGLSFSDESEVEDIPGKKERVPMQLPANGASVTEHPTLAAPSQTAGKAASNGTAPAVNQSVNGNSIEAELVGEDLDAAIEVARNFIKPYGNAAMGKGKKLAEIPLDFLVKDLQYWEARAIEKGETIKGPLKQYLDNIRVLMHANEALEKHSEEIPF